MSLIWRKSSLQTLVVSTLLLLLPATVTAASDYKKQRQLYLDARDALKNNQTDTYQQLRQQLDGYPLVIYLDFNANLDAILKMRGKQAYAAMQPFVTSPLYDMARHRYLLQAGDAKRWQDFLEVSADLPRATELQCYYYQAKLNTGDSSAAYKGAGELWLTGHSLPKPCDPLLKAWTHAGLRSQELIWSRMLLSFDEGETGLLSFLAQKVTQHKAQAQLLLDVYRDPRTLRHTRSFSGQAPIYGDIVAAGLKRLASKDLKQAFSLYAKYQQAGRFNDDDGRKLNRYLVWYALLKREDGLRDIVDTMLPLLRSDDLTERRLRWALAEQDNTTVKKLLPLLSDDTRNDARWQYWQHRFGLVDDATYAKIAEQRNFYGFAVASELGKPLNLANDPTVHQDNLQARLADDPGLARVKELMALDKWLDAKPEWSMLLQRHNRQMQAQYGLYALQQGWEALAVDASISARLWDDLAMRFPLPEKSSFDKAGKTFSTPVTELRAISRRESAYNPYATSGAGARGFMQLMPGTAARTAKKYKLPYAGVKSLYQPEINIPLGSAYYSQLLQQFNGNRILATAAYNAGPSRVSQWLKDSQGKLDLMTFVEVIPFTETREYVQAVFTYRVIYERKQQQTPAFFSSTEMQYHY
ncbi:transglycosylase SLT domain-containing protein [Shewanella dokdonensis]|uniref:transglycosylase SLT domain-containing protein n=2 Tax=Shewanella dokdonensis TaxID=712036 RepID=UPI00200C4E54|nr:transglycosylase SLT domain-containing protein [Shewanella dokdonensis]MCL1076096.1 transglycosylase SLT domain-containing protein [Shewanella dokdonensis]